MQATIIGIDKMSDGAVKLYMQSTENFDSFTDIKKADGSHYVDRIGRQCFDVFMSKSGIDRYASLGLNAQVLEVFYKKEVPLPVVHKSYNGRYYMALDDFGMAALLINLKTSASGKE